MVMVIIIIEGGKFGKWLTESLFFLRATTTKIIVMKVFYYAGFRLSLENVTAPQVRILPTKNQRSQGEGQIVLKKCFQAQNQFPAIRTKRHRANMRREILKVFVHNSLRIDRG